jgi:hypothetical protein
LSHFEISRPGETGLKEDIIACLLSLETQPAH